MKLTPSPLHLIVLSLLFSLIPSESTAQGKGKGGKGGKGRVDVEKAALAEPFFGLTTDGTVIPDLFSIEATGVSTETVKTAAEAFISSLTEEQKKKTLFPVDDDEWRKWANQHHYVRQGVSFEEMNDDQRELAFALMQSGLSARGFQNARDIMKLNGTLAELKNTWDGYGEWLYHITIMGEPSLTEPWGWQFDGHHAAINYFILGDQVVMSPVFIGSEPVRATSGKHKGTVIMQEEQDRGLAFMKSLSTDEQASALIATQKEGTNAVAEAFKDNLITDSVGIKADKFSDETKARLLDLIAVWINHQKEGHAKVRLSEIASHIDDTYFAWIGETSDDSVFYYRIQSPVIFIEFDHQRPIGLERTGIPTRDHIHAVIRTPNGNDYGKDLLRQHFKDHHH
ncbi:MAG: DUF3500 domain-containing protein [Verrucomicrobiales bacterium]|nr:DUF3500 domain-containing protein [Verrucomicrobiales bacterium]